MQKPNHMSVKEWLIKRMALSSNIPEKVINAVIAHQFDGVRAAMDTDNYTVQVCGFGKFVFNKKKSLKRFQKYNAQIKFYKDRIDSGALSKEVIRKDSLKLKTAIKNLEHLKIKIKDGDF